VELPCCARQGKERETRVRSQTMLSPRTCCPCPPLDCSGQTMYDMQVLRFSDIFPSLPSLPFPFLRFSFLPMAIVWKSQPCQRANRVCAMCRGWADIRVRVRQCMYDFSFTVFFFPAGLLIITRVVSCSRQSSERECRKIYAYGLLNMPIWGDQ
jgi:hypothetical protein